MKIKNYKLRIKDKEKGFTLVETLVAIVILALTLNALFTLITSSIFSAKYAKNEITATYLAQEAIDRIRNDRDTMAFQKYGSNDWSSFLSKYGPTEMCFSIEGCSFDATDLSSSFSSLVRCTGACPKFHYSSDLSGTVKNYYNYDYTKPETSFERNIKMKLTNSGNEVDVIITVKWLNGNNEHSRVLTTSLLNWR